MTHYGVFREVSMEECDCLCCRHLDSTEAKNRCSVSLMHMMLNGRSVRIYQQHEHEIETSSRDAQEEEALAWKETSVKLL